MSFFARNVHRVNKVRVYDYKPFSMPFYKLDKVHFRVDKKFEELISNYHNCLDGSKCDQVLYKKVHKTIFGKYLFVNIKRINYLL